MQSGNSNIRFRRIKNVLKRDKSNGFLPIGFTKTQVFVTTIKNIKPVVYLKTLLNTNLNLSAILLDDVTSAVFWHGNVHSPNEIYSYTPIRILANRIWPCYLRPNSTYVTYVGICLLNWSSFWKITRLFETS